MSPVPSIIHIVHFETTERSLNPTPPHLPTPVATIGRLAKLQIDRKEVKFDSGQDVLGSGQFGEVYRAIYEGKAVAVKQLTDHSAASIKDLGDEAVRSILKIFSLFHHQILMKLTLVSKVNSKIACAEYNGDAWML